jgi:tetratricopeptide (TPR) repeat protein
VERSTTDVGDTDIDTPQILAAAEWARQQIGVETLGYEETRNLARTFREYGKPEEAIEKFKLASSMKSDNWLSQWGLALTYHKQEEWTLALETLESVKKAIESGEAVEDDPSTETSKIIRSLASWNKDAGNDDKALEIYESILKNEPEDYVTAFEIMSLLRKKGDFAKLFEFLEALKYSKDETSGLDRRTQIFHTHSWNEDYHETIAIMGAHTKNFDAVKDGYQAAVDAAEAKLNIANIDREDEANTKGVMAMLLHFFAFFFYNNYSTESEKQTAISLWERILGMEETGNVDYYIPYVKGLVTNEISSIYLRKALSAEKDSENAALYVKHLEQLSTTNSDEEIYDWSTQTYPKQLLARYYALTNQPEKAKEVLRSHIKIGIDLLSDEDKLNDWLGYKSLTMHFMFAGQDDNAHAAWSLITPEKREEEIAKVEDQDFPSGDQTEQKSDPNPHDDSAGTKQQPVADPTKELEGPLTYICDGRCGTLWKYPNDIYVCRECHDIQFDEGCLAKLRAGTLQRQICHKDHEMFHVPKYDKEKLDSIGEGNVKVGEEIMTVEDWIRSIKKEWAIAL